MRLKQTDDERKRAYGLRLSTLKRSLPLTALFTLMTVLPAASQSTNQQVLDELQRLRDRVQQLEADAQTRQVGDVKTPVKRGKKGISLSLSGQVNRGVLFYDDGDKTDLRSVDNDNSSTRIRFIGKGKINEEWSAGTNIEVQFESNSTASVNQLNERGVGPDNFTQRKLELYFQSDSLGRLTLGQGDTASNGTSERDLSGTTVIGYSGISDLAGGLIIRNSTTNTLGLDLNADGDFADPGEFTNPTVGGAFSNLDGLSRDDRIRYDTPRVAGFHAAGSIIEGNRWDASLDYKGMVAGLKLNGAVAYSERRGGAERLNGSISALHAPTGLSLTFAAGQDMLRGPRDPVFYYVKGGYQANLIPLGKTAFSVDYYKGEEMVINKDNSDSFGVQVVQNIDKAATELYIGYRNYNYDQPGTNFDEVSAVLAGARIKF